VTEGTRISVRLDNRLDVDSSIHWHGLPQRGSNAMDGVPGVTQRGVGPGGTFLYEFVAEPAGTFFFHSHFGLQIEHGLYASLIIEPRRELLAYDREYVIVLDDWPADSPERMLANLRAGRPPIPGMNAPMAGMTAGPPSGGVVAAPGGTSNVAEVVAEVGPDVAYKTFLLNGRPPSDAPTLPVRRGDRVRLRLVNAGAATPFRVTLAGHRMVVTHADGASVRPVTVDALEIAMGERYDVLIAADNPGTWALDARSADEPDRSASAVVRYAGVAPNGVTRSNTPDRGREVLLRYADLVSEAVAPWSNRPDRMLELPLRGQMVPYAWSIGGLPSPAPPLGVRAGELVQVRMRNESPMRHPMHLHGHSFRLRSANGRDTVLKDTASVEPGATLEFQFRADNPGAWLFHCHHAYHQEVGMMRVLHYLDR
jgi:FtsP/CotA-like multicopper oxidase with cupredoxin domain